MLKPLCHLLTLLILQDRFPVGQFLGLPKAGQPTQTLRHRICRGVCLDTQRDLKLKMEGCVLHLGSYPTWTKSILHCPLPAIFPSATLSGRVDQERSQLRIEVPLKRAHQGVQALTDLRVAVQSFASWWSQSNLSFCCWIKLGIFLSE